MLFWFNFMVLTQERLTSCPYQPNDPVFGVHFSNSFNKISNSSLCFSLPLSSVPCRIGVSGGPGGSFSSDIKHFRCWQIHFLSHGTPNNGPLATKFGTEQLCFMKNGFAMIDLENLVFFSMKFWIFRFSGLFL